MKGSFKILFKIIYNDLTYELEWINTLLFNSYFHKFITLLFFIPFQFVFSNVHIFGIST
jgi:hypothetical protein